MKIYFPTLFSPHTEWLASLLSLQTLCLELTLFSFYRSFSPLAPKLPPNAELCRVTDSL